MSFKINQKVVCCSLFEGKFQSPISGRWIKSNMGWYPIKNEIYTISNFHEGYLILKECPELSAFQPSKFRPLDYDFVEDVINKVTEKQLTY